MIKRRRGAGEHKQSKRAFNFTPALSLDHYSERMTLFVVRPVRLDAFAERAYSCAGRIHPQVRRLGRPATAETAASRSWRLALRQACMRSTAAASSAFSARSASPGLCSTLTALGAFEPTDRHADLSRTFLHGLRRNAFTSATFQLLHFPLTASLILASSAMPEMVQTTEPVQVRCRRLPQLTRPARSLVAVRRDRHGRRLPRPDRRTPSDARQARLGPHRPPVASPRPRSRRRHHRPDPARSRSSDQHVAPRHRRFSPRRHGYRAPGPPDPVS